MTSLYGLPSQAHSVRGLGSSEPESGSPAKVATPSKQALLSVEDIERVEASVNSFLARVKEYRSKFSDNVLNWSPSVRMILAASLHLVFAVNSFAIATLNSSFMSMCAVPVGALAFGIIIYKWHNDTKALDQASKQATIHSAFASTVGQVALCFSAQSFALFSIWGFIVSFALTGVVASELIDRDAQIRASIARKQ
ncbi:MAG: hypothetical protein H0X51_02545 [Parachlamydiaceae bacterium]|nr:hypothetical protein [Parachlamydiaceae bacterium]